MVAHIVDVSEVILELGLSGTVTDEERAFVSVAITEAEGAVRQHLMYDPIQAERTEYHPQQPFQAQISRGIWEVMEQRAVLRQVSEAATNELQLQHLPVRDITLSVWRDYDGRSGTQAGSFPASSLLDEGPSYWPNFDVYDSAGVKVCRDGVLRTIGLWPTTAGTVKVTYTSGYTAAEFRGLSGGVLDASPIWGVAKDEAARRARRMIVQKKGRVGMLAGVVTSENLGDYSYSVDGASVARLFAAGLTPESVQRLTGFVNMGWPLGS